MKRNNPFGELGSTSGEDSGRSSDDYRNIKRPRVADEQEDPLSPSWATVVSPEIDGKKKQVNELGRSIYEAICSLGYDNFKTKMEKKDDEFIDSLTLSIEALVDQLSMIMYDIDSSNWSNIPIIDPNNCTKLRHHCHKDTRKCARSLPGYYTKSKKQHGDPRKAFIPQMYKVLQDYGFFHRYLGYNMIDEYVPFSTLDGIKWGIKIGYKLGTIPGVDREDKKKKEIEYLKTMRTRIRRVQFLRAFDVRCCLEKEGDASHKKFDSILEKIYIALDEEMTRRTSGTIV